MNKAANRKITDIVTIQRTSLIDKNYTFFYIQKFINLNRKKLRVENEILSCRPVLSHIHPSKKKKIAIYLLLLARYNFLVM